MKKIILSSLILFSMILGFSSCNGCKGTVEKKENTVAVQKDSVIKLAMIDHMISTDREQMFMQVSNDYRWFETCVQFNNFFDEENDGSVYSVVNIFQAIFNADEKSADVVVYAFTHLADTMGVFPKAGFWIEDFPLEEEVIKLNFEQAYERMMSTNSPKPHSRQACLRKPIGPVECNPQYVFGNIHSQLWVDAVTGEVKNSNPAFPEEKGFKMPLGEWP